MTITRFPRRLVAPLVLAPILWAAIPSAPARADDGVAWLLVGGELLVLGGGVATTIAISVDSDPPAPLYVTHFTLAAANLGIGAAIIGLGLSIEGGGGASIGGAIRTFLITFGVLQILNGAIMAVLGAIVLASDDDEAATPAMLVPLTLRF